MTTTPYTRTIYAMDSAAAQAGVKHLAKRDGYRVRTVKSVRLVNALELESVPPVMPRYTVTLAVDVAPGRVVCE